MVMGFASFDGIVRLASQSRAALLVALRPGLGEAEIELLAGETLLYVELARDGFALSARASDLAGVDQPAFLRRWGISGEPRDGDERTEREALSHIGRPLSLVRDGREALQAFGQARVALALIPRLPAAAVSWPPRPTYVDVPRPRGAGELVDRLEEIERTIWRLSVRREPPERDHEPARRTLAFFDAIVYLGGDPRALA
ncbi:MAG TPA: hypothetical protein VEY67_05295 [Candidatus Dormibacteraeota bacterium]|nr:hypothetical protein [Candidatus Dormibacteraeota bacterium]